MIRTSKYRWWNFIPKNLCIQFSKLANVYFLVIMFLQVIKPISITNGQPNILLPLVIVVVMSALKDLAEDVKRHKSDNAENDSQVLVLDSKTGQFITKKWRDIKIGEIVKVVEDTQFPADLFLLNSSVKGGICYVETKSLDGETNLKHKESIKDIALQCTTDSQVHALKAEIQCEEPNDKIYKFDGIIRIND